MHVTVLAVPGCPHLPVLDERLTEALDGLPGVSISRQVIAIEDEAVRSGMHGSPTILIDGIDPYAPAGAAGQRVVAAIPGIATDGPAAPPR